MIDCKNREFSADTETKIQNDTILFKKNFAQFMTDMQKELIAVKGVGPFDTKHTYSWCDSSLYPFRAKDIKQMNFLGESERNKKKHRNYYFDLPQEGMTVMILAFCKEYDVYYGVYFSRLCYNDKKTLIGKVLAQNFVFYINGSKSENNVQSGRAEVKTQGKRLGCSDNKSRCIQLKEILLQLYGELGSITQYSEHNLHIHHVYSPFIWCEFLFFQTGKTRVQKTCRF